MKKNLSKRNKTIRRLVLGAGAASALAALGCGSGTSGHPAAIGTYCNSALSSNACNNHNVGGNCCAQYNGNNCIANSVCTGPYENDSTPSMNHAVNAICACNM